jgi:signal transduction histidine kinase
VKVCSDGFLGDKIESMSEDSLLSHPEVKIRILQRMKWRYFVAIALLIASACVTFWLETHANSLKSSDYELINLAGRQRMLSQRLALTSITQDSLFAKDFNRAAHVQELKTEIEAGLSKILHSRFLEDPAISEFYHRSDSVKESTERLIDLAVKNNGQLNQQILDLAYFKLLPQLDEATHLLQLRSQQDFSLRENIAVTAFVITLLVLLLEVLFIFAPLLREVRGSLEEIEILHARAISQARLSAMGELTAFISHELSNSLTIVKPTVNMLADRWEALAPDKKQIYLQRLKNQVERMEKILKAVKYQSRDTQNDPLDEVDLAKVVNESRDLLQERCERHDITLEIRHDGSQALVHAKAGELYQVMNNLMTNAIDSVSQNKAAEKNWIRLEIGKSAEEGEAHLIRISDSGAGVPAALSEKVFEAFFTTKGPEGGTGLGLAICKKIIENLGGKLKLNAQVSPSCFEIHLPG